METPTGEHTRLGPIDLMKIRIDRRVERTLANPNLTREQTQELLMLANLTKLALKLRCLFPAVRFGQQLVELSDPLMIPEETITKQE